VSAAAAVSAEVSAVRSGGEGELIQGEAAEIARRVETRGSGADGRKNRREREREREREQRQRERERERRVLLSGRAKNGSGSWPLKSFERGLRCHGCA